MEAIALSHIIIDDLRDAAGQERRGLLGGAGTYAVAGMRLVSEAVGISCGVGDDFAARYGNWFRANGIDTAGLEIRGRHTPRSQLVYQREDARTETPQFGMAHFAQMAPRPAQLPRSYREARGWYIFGDDDADFWRDVFAIRAARAGAGHTLLWELHEGAARAERWPAVARILRQTDIVSLNRAEGRALTGAVAPEEMLARLLKTGVGAVALRLGGAGALAATAAAGWRIPAYPATPAGPDRRRQRFQRRPAGGSGAGRSAPACGLRRRGGRLFHDRAIWPAGGFALASGRIPTAAGLAARSGNANSVMTRYGSIPQFALRWELMSKFY